MPDKPCEYMRAPCRSALLRASRRATIASSASACYTSAASQSWVWACAVMDIYTLHPEEGWQAVISCSTGACKNAIRRVRRCLRKERGAAEFAADLGLERWAVLQAGEGRHAAGWPGPSASSPKEAVHCTGGASAGFRVCTMLFQVVSLLKRAGLSLTLPQSPGHFFSVWARGQDKWKTLYLEQPCRVRPDFIELWGGKVSEQGLH